MIGIRGKAPSGKQPQDIDRVEILGVERDGDSVMLTAKFEGMTWNKLKSFAAEKGYVKHEELLSLLFSYGLSPSEGVDIQKRHAESAALGARYSAMKFEAYRLFTDNRAMTIALSSMLSENKALRAQAHERGVLQGPDEVWDHWNTEEIDSLYMRYVFVR